MIRISEHTRVPYVSRHDENLPESISCAWGVWIRFTDGLLECEYIRTMSLLLLVVVDFCAFRLDDGRFFEMLFVELLIVGRVVIKVNSCSRCLINCWRLLCWCSFAVVMMSFLVRLAQILGTIWASSRKLWRRQEARARDVLVLLEALSASVCKFVLTCSFAQTVLIDHHGKTFRNPFDFSFRIGRSHDSARFWTARRLPRKKLPAGAERLSHWLVMVD